MDTMLTVCKAKPKDFQLKLTCWDKQTHKGCKARITVKKQQIKHVSSYASSDCCESRDYFYFKCPCCGREHKIPDKLIPKSVRKEIIGPDYSDMISTSFFLIIVATTFCFFASVIYLEILGY